MNNRKVKFGQVATSRNDVFSTINYEKDVATLTNSDGTKISIDKSKGKGEYSFSDRGKDTTLHFSVNEAADNKDKRFATLQGVISGGAQNGVLKKLSRDFFLRNENEINRAISTLYGFTQPVEDNKEVVKLESGIRSRFTRTGKPQRPQFIGKIIPRTYDLLNFEKESITKSDSHFMNLLEKNPRKVGALFLAGFALSYFGLYNSSQPSKNVEKFPTKFSYSLPEKKVTLEPIYENGSFSKNKYRLSNVRDFDAFGVEEPMNIIAIDGKTSEVLPHNYSHMTSNEMNENLNLDVSLDEIYLFSNKDYIARIRPSKYIKGIYYISPNENKDVSRLDPEKIFHRVSRDTNQISKYALLSNAYTKAKKIGDTAMVQSVKSDLANLVDSINPKFPSDVTLITKYK